MRVEPREAVRGATANCPLYEGFVGPAAGELARPFRSRVAPPAAPGSTGRPLRSRHRAIESGCCLMRHAEAAVLVPSRGGPIRGAACPEAGIEAVHEDACVNCSAVARTVRRGSNRAGVPSIWRSLLPSRAARSPHESARWPRRTAQPTAWCPGRHASAVAAHGSRAPSASNRLDVAGRNAESLGDTRKVAGFLPSLPTSFLLQARSESFLRQPARPPPGRARSGTAAPVG